ncbi:site-2 protease family protein [Dissulfurirhabdus thermomarina]|uniref:Site-2 protease family protein n=1 Tax=Dissulfurirhabdus thermomarina TaxID=1765737 RepID=A0A6N9TK21_DISTH|nr:site-2 protease family protein [Dissulfurirhabdus thermomarina]NDY41428.1 site-2 protease family protein [Dissulfurirhabdus thermomarina]NMX24416.1 site-2 protease family protein [Dissulfurirhabdus thermomarina]
MDLHATIRHVLLLTPPILLAVTAHEAAHAWTADRLGDPTPRRAGRLTLNPLRHLDPVGTLVFFLTRAIGWAKPVPVNPYHFRDPRRGMLWVSLAGPAANLALAAAGAALLRGLAAGPSGVIHLPPGAAFLAPLVAMLQVGILVNIGLAVFNLLPVPPLDGSKVLEGLLPEGLAEPWRRFERYGFVLILLLVFTGVTGRIIVPLVFRIYGLFMGLQA